MLTTKAASRLRDAANSLHRVSDKELSFGFGALIDIPEALGAFMRVAADMVENHVEMDVTETMAGSAFYYHDTDEQVVCLIIGNFCQKERTFTVNFGWTNPAFRQMGIFASLMGKIVQCHWESGSIDSLRVNAPLADPIFDKAVTRLGFRPITRVMEYRPYSTD